MKVSKTKTKCMTTAKDPIRCKLEIEGGIVIEVMLFTHLGVDIRAREIWLQNYDDKHSNPQKYPGIRETYSGKIST